jgi:hypothetical protein
MTKYYMVVDQNKCIWGIGKTKSEALKDARLSLGNSSYDEGVVFSKAIECDDQLYSSVFVNGFLKNETWTVVDGIARLDRLIKQEKVKNARESFKDLSIDEKLNAIYEKLTS